MAQKLLPLIEPTDRPTGWRWLAEKINAILKGTSPVTLFYQATITSDASMGQVLVITATNGTAFTIASPVNVRSGQRLIYLIRNASGGALGAITWNAIFKKSAFTNPANGNSRAIEFMYDGTNLVQINAAAVDVPL